MNCTEFAATITLASDALQVYMQQRVFAKAAAHSHQGDNSGNMPIVNGLVKSGRYPKTRTQGERVSKPLGGTCVCEAPTGDV